MARMWDGYSEDAGRFMVYVGWMLGGCESDVGWMLGGCEVDGRWM